MKPIAPTLAAAALLPLASIAFTACHGMSPEGADAFDDAIRNPRPAKPRTPTSATPPPTPASPPAADYPPAAPADPSTLPPSMGSRLMPLPEPVPRQ